MRRLVLALVPLLLTAAAPTSPRVAVPGGIIEGQAPAAAGDPILFRGVPFAAPPLGPLRWKAPQPVQRWTGIRRAQERAPACLQNDYKWNRADYIASSEDCLTLDIATPSLSGKRPVMVWIHGGSNRAGSAGDTLKAGLARKGVVLVAIQYRLGIFGFLSHRGLAAEAASTSGNYGLMDQIAALRWVQANIARFGGDPANVTIFGESAGAQDVGLLLAAPETKGLFARGILQSGTPDFGQRPRPLDRALRIGDQVDALLNTGGDVARLRAASAPALLAADLSLHDEALQSDDFMWLRPTVDGRVLPDEPRQLLLAASPRPVIIGSNRAEFGLPGDRSHRDADVEAAFGSNARLARDFYKLDLPDPAADPRLGDRDLRISTDILFRCPTGKLADLLAGAHWPVWRYELDAAPGGARSFHGSDITFIHDGAVLTGDLTPQDYWLSFARTGTPDTPGKPAWPSYLPGKRHITFDARGVTPGTDLAAIPCQWTNEI